MPVDYSLHYGTTQNQQQQQTRAATPAATASENLGGVAGLTDLSALINQINLNAQQAANQARIPQGAELQQKSSQDIGQALAGQLPSDVADLIAQQAAERGVSIGSPGSPNAGASLLEALGDTSLNMMGLGQQWLSGAQASNPGAPLFNPATGLVTPSTAGTTSTGTSTGSQTELGSSSYPQRPATAQPSQPSGAAAGIPTVDSWWNNLFPTETATTGPGGTTIPGMEGYLGVQTEDPLAYITGTDTGTTNYAPGWWQAPAANTAPIDPLTGLPEVAYTGGGGIDESSYPTE